MLALTLVLGPAAAHAESIGNCAWTKATIGEREAFIAAYRTGMQAGMAQLGSADAQLQQNVADCTHRSGLPQTWAQGVVGAAAIQDGAADVLNASLRVSRQMLDAAWSQAPEAAKDCTRQNAAKTFGITGPSCPDPKAPVWFLQRLGISPSADRGDATQALYFMNAKAQQEFAEALIARFMERPSAP